MNSCYIRSNWKEFKLCLIVRKGIIHLTGVPHTWINYCFLAKNEKLHIIQEGLNFLLTFTTPILILSFFGILTLTYHYDWLNELFLPPRTLNYRVVILGKADSIGVPRLKLSLVNVRCVLFVRTFLHFMDFKVWTFGVIVIAILQASHLNVIIIKNVKIWITIRFLKANTEIPMESVFVSCVSFLDLMFFKEMNRFNS